MTISSNTSPTKEQILQARTSAGLSQKKAGEVVYASTRTWQSWEYGKRKMRWALWIMFLEKTGQ